MCETPLSTARDEIARMAMNEHRMTFEPVYRTGLAQVKGL